MIDRRLLTDSPDRLRSALGRRGAGAADIDIDALIGLAEARRAAIGSFETLRSEQNRRQQEVKAAPKGTDEFRALITGLKELSEQVKQADIRRKEVEEVLVEQLLLVPNLPDDKCPDGADETENPELKRTGSIDPSRPVESHVDIGVRLGILDFERAGKVAGARFAVLLGAAARIERGLIQLMLDIHSDSHGYQEVMPPFLVNRDSMTGTGQLPKFEEDAFQTAHTGHFLVPTAEVPVTNLHRDEILDAELLPLRYAAYTPCFRREAGSYGKDTRGLIRLHQFNKVELVWFAEPERSEECFELLVGHACAVLEKLELPYRVVELCAGDLGFGAARCHDLEVWMPSQGRYREISSCSNFRDFQARRANIRYRPATGERPRLVHTLNGSGVAIGRAMAALLENGLQDDGSVLLPAALRPYVGGLERISAPTT